MAKAAPKVPVKPKPKKETKALVSLPVTVVGPSWSCLVRGGWCAKLGAERKLMREAMVMYVGMLKTTCRACKG